MADKSNYWAGEPYFNLLNQFKQALASKESVIVLTGQKGVGKSALSKELRDTLSSHKDCVIYFDQPPRSNAELHQGFRRLQPQLDQFAFMVALEKLLAELYQKSHQVVLIIDNAHLLNIEVITTIRIMSNFQTKTHRLLQVILCGAPSLFKVLHQPKCSGFSQRISHNLTILPMNKTQLNQLVEDLHSINLSPLALNLMFALCKGKPGIAIKMGNLLTAQPTEEVITARQLSQIIAKDQQMKQLINRHRMKSIALPSAAATIIAGFFWFIAQTPTSAPSPIAKEQTRQETTKPVAKTKQPDTTASESLLKPISVDVSTIEKTAPSSESEIDDAFVIQSLLKPVSVDVSTIEKTAPSSESEIDDAFVIQNTQNDVIKPTSDTPVTPPQEFQISKPSLSTVVQTDLQTWIDAWQTKDVTTYVAAYTHDFSPNNGSSRQQWVNKRSRRILEANSIELSFDDIEITTHTQSHLTVRLWLKYASPSYKDETLKELIMVLQNGDWLIRSEKNKMVKHGDKIYLKPKTL
jgi:energy-coupling factor transporter ATP-binding protein EcfA2